MELVPDRHQGAHMMNRADEMRLELRRFKHFRYNLWEEQYVDSDELFVIIFVLSLKKTGEFQPEQSCGSIYEN